MSRSSVGLCPFYLRAKAEVFAGFKKGRAGADEIPAATQLFTPHWIVRYLVENSLGRLWMLKPAVAAPRGSNQLYCARRWEPFEYERSRNWHR